MKLENNNHWLFLNLRDMSISMSETFDPYIRITEEPPLVIWTPGNDVYKVTEEMVEHLADEGVNLISYADSWSTTSLEAKMAAKRRGVQILRHAETFKFIRTKYEKT